MLHAHRPDAPPLSVRPQHAPPGGADRLPRHRLPDGEMDPETAYRVVHDELLLDGQARLNLATFVTTWMEPQAARLMAECHEKNMIDKDEYPLTAEIEARCVSMIAGLWNAPTRPDGEGATGCSTLGSSEACMLAGLAFKRHWEARRRAAGASVERPNLVMGANVQVCWEKFCRYFDVEARQAPLAPGRTHLDADSARPLVDEHTIGVVAILGSTMDGSYEPVAEIAAMLDALEDETGLDVPVHVDAASGGFVAPFLDPDLLWDFRVPRVRSINASGHKYGLVYPGVGWAVWRSRDALPEELVFHVNYLGGDMPTYGLNFSRPGAQVVAQYYELLRLGFEGYRRVQQASRDTATWMAARIAEIEPFELVSDGSELPVFAVRIREGETAFDVYDVSARLRQYGWLVPAYTFPEGLQDLAVLRVVVRNGFGPELAAKLVEHLGEVVAALSGRGAVGGEPTAFHH
ncbi:glutamate decarboxylase [Conexibacter sp. W3-3-2]|uniref:Glutamate decarboxylase n=1 Tax=Paraconexibacter algicola TaxID=2133960 RepID=A0A2T4UID4_9ACTN|nr:MULTISPECIES: glutamate decarboxylase [Solirubrobacterales]MTD45307.1 glutamate decarboxylase [Conexibacter sp. W3-3-2]PTL59003.1 glutamate decarboxylase [Paraconexibacter algicola]